MRTFARWSLVALALAGVGAAMFADGDTRPITSAEKAFARKAMGILCGAIPPPSSGWTVTRRSDTEPPSFLSGTKPRPMELFCEQTWEDTGRKRRAQSEAMTAMANVKSDPKADVNAEAAEKRFQEVMGKISKAAEKGDQAEMNKLQPEMQAASKAYQDALMAKNKGFLDASAKATVSDANAHIRIEANARYEYLDVKGQEAVAPGITGYRVNGPSGGQGATWVFLGPWQISKDGRSTRFQLPPLSGPSTSVATVKVRVEGEPSRAKAILAKVDWAALKGLVK